MEGIKIPFRSSTQQYTLDSFAFRFVRGSCMRPAPASEGDPSLADIAIKATTEVSAAAAATAAGGDGGGAGVDGSSAATGALLDSDVEDQVGFRAPFLTGLGGRMP